MPLVTKCNHSFYCDTDYTPTKEEVNIFRLWQCNSCDRWLSFVDVVKGDKIYKELQVAGFTRAYQNIKWK